LTVSVKDVARAAGVSLGTVSNVLNKVDTVSPENVTKVMSAVKKLGYVRNDAARLLRAGKSRTVGVIVQDVGNPFYAELIRGAKKWAVENQLNVLVADSDESLEREHQLLGVFDEHRVLGVLVSPMEQNLDRLLDLKRRGRSVVVVDQKANDNSISSVSVDDVAGGFMAVEHLIAQGRKRIAFVGGPLNSKQIRERLKGAKKAVAKNPGVTLEIMETENLTVLDGRLIGDQLAKLPKNRRPNAIFAANDLVAIGILQSAVMTLKFSVPADIALIGYDDIEFSSTAIVPLSSIRQPTQEIGAQAMHLLLRESEGDTPIAAQQIVFQPILVIRDSTKL